MRRVIEWFIENHVAANLLMIFIVVAGVVTAITTKVEIFPETVADKVVVTVVYPGASPSEVEEGIVKKIEQVISGLDGVKEINSYASEGIATIEVEAIKGWNLDQLFDDIKSEVNRITTLPEEAERPVVKKFVFKAPVLNVAVYGDAPISALKEWAERIKDDITAMEGISQVDLFGTATPVISIEVPEYNLRKYHLSIEDVASAVRQWSFDTGAGEVKTEAGYILLRVKGKGYEARDYRDIVVLSEPQGKKVRLSEIANIKETFEDSKVQSRFNGKPGVGLLVYRIGRQNALDVASKVHKYVAQLRPALPPNIQVEIFGDQSEILKERLTLLLKNMAYGMVLVVILLGIFLNRKLAFWITVGIPIAFSFGLIIIPHYGISINMISLFAFIMVLGIVVDDAIVVGESIFRYRQKGLPPLKAAVEGTMVVAMPVTFAVITTIAAFWPMLYGSGVMGKVIRNIPVVVIAVLVGSLVEAFLILPVHLYRAKMPKKGERKENFVNRCLEGFIKGPYRTALRIALKYRYATVALALAVLMLFIGLWKGGRVKFTYFPKVESDTMVCELVMPPGTPFEETLAIIKRIERAAEEAAREANRLRQDHSTPLIRYSFSMVGQIFPMGHRAETGPLPSGSHVGQVIVQLISAQERKELPTSVITHLWRQKVGTVPGAETLRFYSELFSAGKAVSFNLSMKDEDTLHRAIEALKAELAKYPGVYDIEDSYIPGKDEIRLTIKESAKSLGITLQSLAQQVRDAFYGAEALRLQRGPDEVKVLVRYPEEERAVLKALLSMYIRTPDGREVPLREVASLKKERSYVTITRKDRKRIINVSAEVDEEIMNAEELRGELFEKVMPALKERFSGLKYELAGEGKERMESMHDVMQGFALALILIYTLIAVPLRSFGQPVVIMLAIPFGLIGAILGHLIMGLNLSIISMFGIVGLSGVVVNDSLILFSEINRLRREGLETFEAVLKGTALRFRAVILTTVTTFGGLTPMILERSLQARFLIPMAVTIAFGVLIATGITLVLTPCGYLIMEDIRKIFSRKR
jgi:multidrug efflux pump subunit AcrB